MLKTASALAFDLVYDANECPVVFTLNDTAVGPACDAPSQLRDMPLGIHRVTLQTRRNGNVVRVNGISGEYPSPSSPTDGERRLGNLTIDNTDPSMSYSPATDWSMVDSSSPGDQVSALGFSNLGGFYNSSLALTSARGAKLDFAFQGEAVYLYGMSGPGGGSAEVLMDEVMQHSLNLSNPWNAYSSLLYFTHGLNSSERHTISVVNTGGGQVIIDYALVTRALAPSSTNNRLPIILGSVAGAITLLLIIVVVAYYRTICRASRPRVPLYGFSTGIGSKSTSSKASSIDSWRKNPNIQLAQTGTASPISPLSYSAGLGTSNASSNATPRLGYRRSGAYAQPGQSPPPDYPDYIPYRGPIEPPPVAMVPTAESNLDRGVPSPPLITGATSLAAGWLDARANLGSPSPSHRSYGSSSGGRATPQRNIPRKPPPLLRRNSKQDRFDAIPLDGYSRPTNLTASADRDRNNHSSFRDSAQPQSSRSSSTTMSAAQAVVTRQAQEATRSVARLWPSRAAVPSDFILSSIGQCSSNPTSANPVSGPGASSDLIGSNSAVQGTRGASALDNAANHSRAITPQTTIAGYFTHSAHLPFLSSPPPPTALARHLSANRPDSPLRRGVSIKSVKTVRSFFSGLLSSSPVPPTPSLPHHAAARPDSGIFPMGLSRSGSTTTMSGSRTPAPLRLGNGSGTDETSPNFFIELNPNSPMTEFSRPESTWTSRWGH